MASEEERLASKEKSDAARMADEEHRLFDAAIFIEPYEAFNITKESIMLLDCCMMQHDDADSHEEGIAQTAKRKRTADGNAPLGALPGSAWLGTDQPLLQAADVAHKYVMENLTPDCSTEALVLYDDRDRAEALATWLRASRGCERVRAVERAALRREHGFLLHPGSQSLRLPNEIVAGKLFLGSAASSNEKALDLLRITAVCSLTERKLAPPQCTHLQLFIPDACGADLDSAIREALPFIKGELSAAAGRVLVHCEAGQSRSASIVVAALMAGVAGLPQPMDFDAALSLVRAQRPEVRPNDGFVACLRTAAWL